jgi:hypothetical protein
VWGVLIAVGAVGGLLWWGAKRALDPMVKTTQERRRFQELRAVGPTSLDEAEDGLVLARRFGDKAAEAEFRNAVARMKQRRG